MPEETQSAGAFSVDAGNFECVEALPHATTTCLACIALPSPLSQAPLRTVLAVEDLLAVFFPLHCPALVNYYFTKDDISKNQPTFKSKELARDRAEELVVKFYGRKRAVLLCLPPEQNSLPPVCSQRA